jgi:hypothetical protein
VISHDLRSPVELYLHLTVHARGIAQTARQAVDATLRESPLAHLRDGTIELGALGSSRVARPSFG